ncbi:MAG: [protein-PII] uridylyltransferase [Pseudomonadota bacterium]|nr:[protein-PII] uridylyltransferase [Pseudomonadota bacterium]
MMLKSQIKKINPEISSNDRICIFKNRLTDLKNNLEKKFLGKLNIENIIKKRSIEIDLIISDAFKIFLSEFTDKISLISVGGYGRSELHPCSDIDLLIITNNKRNNQINKSITKFITFLWDIGLDVGHSVRTNKENIQLARKDQTIYTTIIENRYLCGSKKLYKDFKDSIFLDNLWEIKSYFNNKVKEQRLRHARYDDTAYKLEPNLKGSPGGLRDIHVFFWIAKKYLKNNNVDAVIKSNLISKIQYKELMKSRSLLWKMRFGLHMITNRSEDRLLFNHQIKLAKLLGYKKTKHKLAIEILMQDYYRAVMEINNTSEVLMQILEEKIFNKDDKIIENIDDDFRIINGYIEAKKENIFSINTSNLLKVFLLLTKNPKSKGIGAKTITLIKRNRHLINKSFINNKINQNIFLDILKAPKGVTIALRKMNTYGILGLYIPSFGKIVGHMQYDLFHTYTVDAHTLFVVENLREVSLTENNHKNLKSSTIMQSLDKPYIAYLAAIFHDIAKGRGGDHSELGSIEAEQFCLNHGLSTYDSRLVGWLVKNHLLLSVTAQKKDLNDPEVIREFITVVGDQIHLDYLYVLTVADVKATNPKTWNSWKAALFWELYLISKSALMRGKTNLIDSEELIKEKLSKVEEILEIDSLEPDNSLIKKFDIWKDFTEEYFLRHKPNEIAWHTRVLSTNNSNVILNINNNLVSGLSALMILAPYKIRSFIRATAALDKLGISIVDARIVLLSKKDQVLHTYFILNSEGKMISDKAFTEQILFNLSQDLNKKSYDNIKINRKASRQVRVFSTPTKINLSKDSGNNRTVLELIAQDQPGLLAKLGKVFFDLNIRLQNAKISTIGERAEDVFFITNAKNQALGLNACDKLSRSIKKNLSN